MKRISKLKIPYQLTFHCESFHDIHSEVIAIDLLRVFLDNNRRFYHMMMDGDTCGHEDSLLLILHRPKK